MLNVLFLASTTLTRGSSLDSSFSDCEYLLTVSHERRDRSVTNEVHPGGGNTYNCRAVVFSFRGPRGGGMKHISRPETDLN